MHKALVAVVALLALPTTAVAGFNGVPNRTSLQISPAISYVTPTGGRRMLKSAHGASARKKSERQKCLDMMLPQDGVACMKKLKTKKK